MSLIKLDKRSYIDPDSISFLTTEKVQQMSGPALLRMTVIVDGHRVVLNNEEALALITALKLGEESE